jgi:uncharacterized membrane protein
MTDSTDDPRDDPDEERPADGPAPDAMVGHGLLDADMGPSSAMAHLYRGEIHRMKLWRERLDRTTNWAVIVLAAVLTWAFSAEGNPHYVLLIGNVAIGLFLVTEARRYRAYDIWRSRVRTIQENVWAPGLDPSVGPRDPEWRRELAYDYCEPTLKITAEEALAHRLRRIYLPLFTVLNAAWLVRVTAFGGEQWPASAAIGMIPGTVVTGVVAVAYAVALVLAFRPRTWHAHAELRTEALRKANADNPMAAEPPPEPAATDEACDSGPSER